ncbi:DUF455 domain protein [Hypomontagnella monticulosa]|nr:DUF455 domain protein [Hypomontagnella monticulosa]
MQGFNMGRYVPPDVEGTTSGNKLHKKRPPGFSANGAQQTIRFEMPFAVWCAHCPKPTLIGQGVRFNATKRKVGAYHSTPIFAFRMRHADCGGDIEIRTDPANTTYTVVSGGRKRDVEDPISASLSGAGVGVGIGGEPILTDKEREALRTNAFAKLERTIADRKVLEDAKERIEELEQDSARRWEDPYEQNRRLRAAFRVGRHERERDAVAATDLRDRMSLGIELVAATDEDARRAALVDFGPSSAAEEGAEMGRAALAKPLFGANNSIRSEGEKQKGTNTKTKNKKLKSEVAAAQTRDSLVSEIVGNTRVAQDPFLALDRGNGEGTKGPPRILGIKRKRAEVESEKDTRLDVGEHNGLESEKVGATNTGKEEKGPISSTTLVEYDSD